MLDPGRGRTGTGWLWALARDDRPWGGADPPAVACLHADGRSAEHAAAHLDGFRGILQVDGHAACRRRFHEIAEAGQAPIAEEALRRIGELHAVEAEVRGTSAAERQAARQTRARPLVEALRPWFEARLNRLPAKSRLAEAIRHALRHRQGAGRYVEDGRIEIDPNVVERAIRPLALTRKNALFAGSDEGARHWAVVASLVETWKLNGVNPHAWLADVLERLVAGHLDSRIDQIMPRHYAPAQQM